MVQSLFHIRRATVEDAEGVAMVLSRVVSERVHSAIDRAWTADQQRSYLESLSSREAFHVAIAASGDMIGYQSLDLYSPVLPSMAHVGQLGTFLLPEWRGRGVGQALFNATMRFGASVGYRKLVVQVRASNVSAQASYTRVGFVAVEERRSGRRERRRRSRTDRRTKTTSR